MSYKRMEAKFRKDKKSAVADALAEDMEKHYQRGVADSAEEIMKHLDIQKPEAQPAIRAMMNLMIKTMRGGGNCLTEGRMPPKEGEEDEGRVRESETRKSIRQLIEARKLLTEGELSEEDEQLLQEEFGQPEEVENVDEEEAESDEEEVEEEE